MDWNRQRRIIVVCDSYAEAEDLYDKFTQYIYDWYPSFVTEDWPNSCSIELYDEKRIIFTDKAFANHIDGDTVTRRQFLNRFNWEGGYR